MEKEFQTKCVFFFLCVCGGVFVYFFFYSNFPVKFITKTGLFKYIEISPPKTENFHIKNSNIFHISAQNINCEYSLEPPH